MSALAARRAALASDRNVAACGGAAAVTAEPVVDVCGRIRLSCSSARILLVS